MKSRFTSAEVSYFLLINIVILATVLYAHVLEGTYSDIYYLSVQEDEYIEWSSFWAFMLATFAYFRGATIHGLTTRPYPWFLCGVALFCFIVAMEEISWGQRVIGYRPPTYFLEHNFQQEFNFHNVMETDYRKIALMVIVFGYGIALPLMNQFSLLRRRIERIGIVAPTIALLPAFTGTFVLYYVYPWSHSGEWVELMLGLGFLFSALPLNLNQTNSASAEINLHQVGKFSMIAFVAIVALGLVSAAISRMQREVHPANLAAAETEVEAIARDFETGHTRSRCNLHKRLYTFMEKYHQDAIYKGSFSKLQAEGLPAERADFFLDPWNSPYWIRDRCNKKTNERILFVYSFGPNRRRDSTRYEILGDDIGKFVPTSNLVRQSH